MRLFYGEVVVALEEGSVWAFVVLENEILGIEGFLKDKKVESTLRLEEVVGESSLVNHHFDGRVDQAKIGEIAVFESCVFQLELTGLLSLIDYLQG